ncbi:hypothetical protein ILUMI_04171 [Ignelater luminosus]|uniref:Uncharacterized protein n=1 Tax=Ignelater luminosus TaxID=2038154 RepID=A0A8K0DKB3_IGNLU|nr:hypothetical protein ILUMI_04171 [Ignelater luminosus]
MSSNRKNSAVLRIVKKAKELAERDDLLKKIPKISNFMTTSALNSSKSHEDEQHPSCSSAVTGFEEILQQNTQEILCNPPTIINSPTPDLVTTDDKTISRDSYLWELNEATRDFIATNVSTDQKYLYEICQAVSTGSSSPELANRQPGKMVHSRWLTSANRLLRLYVSTFNLSENLQLLVNYVIKVYAPIWFLIKQNTSLKDRPKHIFQLIMYSRFLPKNLRSVMDSVIERNAFFAHPENLLVSMLFDDKDHIRELALRRIIKARELKVAQNAGYLNLQKLTSLLEITPRYCVA